jgi:hypothetical protein
MLLAAKFANENAQLLLLERLRRRTYRRDGVEWLRALSRVE